MRPVLILQQLHDDGPGNLAPWLAARGVPFELRNAQAGQMPPADLSAHAGLVLLGGEMSANDDLPALRAAEGLVLQALSADKPVLGICLGAQLMARALGQAVSAAPAPEVGWHQVQVQDSPWACEWLGAPGPHTVFQWHYEVFAPPPGARLLAGSAACPHQAFVLGCAGGSTAPDRALHLGLQFHPEVDAAKLAGWLREPCERHAAAARAHPASVQPAPALRTGAEQGLPALRTLADRLYTRWLQGVPR